MSNNQNILSYGISEADAGLKRLLSPVSCVVTAKKMPIDLQTIAVVSNKE
jgi:hypothetical protein